MANMKVLSYTSNFACFFTIWMLVSSLSGFPMIQGFNGTRFLEKPNNTTAKTGETVKFVWIYEDTSDLIELGELFADTGGGETLLFRANPNTNESSLFGPDDYKKRVHASLAVPLKLSIVSVQIVLSNVMTNDTGSYSFKVSRFGKNEGLSKVSLYVTDLYINCSAPFYVDTKQFVRFNAVGKPDPICTRRYNRTSVVGISCNEELVPLTQKYFNVSLSARNKLGLEKSCWRVFLGQSTSGAVLMSYSVNLLTVLFLITSMLYHD